MKWIYLVVFLLVLSFSWCRDEKCLCHLALSNRTDAWAPTSTLCAGKKNKKKTGMASQAATEKVLCRKPGHTFQISHWLNKANLSHPISSCWLVEPLSRTVMLVSCSTSPGQKYLSTSWRTFLARMGLCTHPRSPQPELLLSPPWVAWAVAALVPRIETQFIVEELLAHYNLM